MSDSNKRKGKKTTSNDLQSVLDSLKSKGVHVLLVDGKIKLRGNVDRNIKSELRILKANRETLCLLLEIESTTCDDTPENDSENDSDRDTESGEGGESGDDKSKQAKQSSSSSPPSLDITPNMSQAQIEERIRQYNERVRLEREEINAKRRDRSLIEVKPGVFRDREEVDKENNTYIFDMKGPKIPEHVFEARLNQFREWTESQWRERD